jgi:hypothetical protein
MLQLFQQSEATAALRRLFFQAVDATNGIDAETGLTGTGFYSKNGASAVASASIVEVDSTNMPGRYYVEFTAAQIDTLGIIEFRFKDAACAEVVMRGQVVPYDPYDAAALGLTRLDAAVSSRSSHGDPDPSNFIDASIASRSAHTAAQAGTDAAGKVLATPANLIATEADGMVHADLKEWLGAAPDVLSSGKVAADLKLWLATAPLALVSQLVQAQAEQLATQAKADVNAEVVDALTVDTMPELAQGAPPVTPTIAEALMLQFMALRQKTTATKTTPRVSVFSDAGVKIVQQTTSDDGETFTREKMVSGA